MAETKGETCVRDSSVRKSANDSSDVGETSATDVNTDLLNPGAISKLPI